MQTNQPAPPPALRLRIHRSDGKTGVYTQNNAARAGVLLKRLNPATLFCSGPITIGTLNPFTLLNPDEICWIETVTALETLKVPQPTLQSVQRLAGRSEYETLLAQQWPLWIKHHQHKPGDLFEAFVECSFRDGEPVYLHVRGEVEDHDLAAAIFNTPAIIATFAPEGTLYINPKCIVRARVYHSRDHVIYPEGIWVAEADEL